MSESLVGPVCPKCDMDFDGGSGRCPQCGFFDESKPASEPEQAVAPEQAGEAEAEPASTQKNAAEDSGGSKEVEPDPSADAAPSAA